MLSYASLSGIILESNLLNVTVSLERIKILMLEFNLRE
jgi:hypothetical protein